MRGRESERMKDKIIVKELYYSKRWDRLFIRSLSREKSSVIIS